MMEMIRSWRIVPVAAWPRAMMDMMRAGIRAITSPKMRSFAKWSIAVIFIGLLTGAMAVVLPPMASIGVVALIGVVLLWAMPDLHVVPDKLLRRMFFIMVVVQLCVPAYYAIDTGILPWISARRFFSVAVIALFALTVAASASARNEIAQTLRANRLLAVCAFGFLAMNFLSVFTSPSPVQSFKEFIDAILNWYVPLCACILIVRSEEDVIFLLKIIAAAAVLDAFAGFLEYFLQRRYYFDIFPQRILESMLSANPGLSAMYYTSSFRNGMYRASSIYSVPLSFGELSAIVSPIGIYFVLHGESVRARLLGITVVICSLMGLLFAGARGGFLAFFVAMTVMLFIWTVRYARQNPGSLVGAIMGAIFLTGLIALAGLVLGSTRLSNIVLGGGDTVSSTEARFRQWSMAWPHILSNPITGHGSGSSGELVGFYNPGSIIPTVDSYVISLLVEFGVPGFLFFSGMVVVGIWVGLRNYFFDASNRGAVGGPIACCLLAFGIYRLVLSQRENHVLFFLFIGIVFALSKLARDQICQNKHSPLRPLYQYGSPNRPVKIALK